MTPAEPAEPRRYQDGLPFLFRGPARRAEAAVIAWMRHQTTGYDGMVIPRVKGKRREVRRMLARHSQDLFGRYPWGAGAGRVPAAEGVNEPASCSGPTTWLRKDTRLLGSRRRQGNHARPRTAAGWRLDRI
jgi:hypothetical protein